MSNELRHLGSSNEPIPENKKILETIEKRTWLSLSVIS